MAGFKADEKMADNVTAGEVSKFVGKNTNYFMRVFGSILRTNKSRFSFVSAILPGAYMLYRKMYAIGIVISVIVVGLLAGTLIIQSTPEFTEAYNIYMDNYSAILQSGYSGANVGDLFAGMSSTNLCTLLFRTFSEQSDLPLCLSAVSEQTECILNTA